MHQHATVEDTQHTWISTHICLFSIQLSGPPRAHKVVKVLQQTKHFEQCAPAQLFSAIGSTCYAIGYISDVAVQ